MNLTQASHEAAVLVCAPALPWILAVATLACISEVLGNLHDALVAMNQMRGWRASFWFLAAGSNAFIAFLVGQLALSLWRLANVA